MTSATKLVQWLGSGDPPAQLTAHLKGRGLVLHAGSPTHSLSPARLSLIGVTASKAASSLNGRRVAVLHPDPGAADALAQSLRQRGGTVLVLSLDPAALDRVEGFDPDAVLVEPADFTGGCWEIVRALWTHPRLRWTPILLTADEPFAWHAPANDLMCQTIQELSAQYDALLKRTASGGAFEVSLATLGPARTLRALVASGGTLRVCIRSYAHAIELDLAEQRVVGARELDPEEADQPLLGVQALAHVLAVDQANVAVRSVTSPATSNVMASLDDALHAARQVSKEPAGQSAGQASSVPSVAGRAFGSLSVPAKGSNPARIYPLRAAIPPLPAPLQSLDSKASRAIPSRHAHAMDTRSASAAALNIEVALEASVVAPSPMDSMPQELASAIPDTALQEVGATWEPAELNRLLADPPEARSTAARAHARKPTVQTLLFALLGLLALAMLSLLVRSASPPPTANASSKPATQALRIRVSKLAPEPPVAPLEEFSELGNEDALDANKAAVRRASALVSEGHAFRREGKIARAESSYREALRAYSGYPRALAGLSRIALEQGDGITAVRYARSLVRARPQQAASHLLLGDALRASGKLVAAKNAWKVAARRGDRTAKQRLE